MESNFFKICILLFFLVMFFIFHIFFNVKDDYENFTSKLGGFREGFANNLKHKQKTKLKLGELSERANKSLPAYTYKEDIPTNERETNNHNSIVNNASEIVKSENYIKNIDKNLDDSNFIFNTGKDIWSKFYCSIYDALNLDKTKNRYEIREIVYTTKIDDSSKILDVGSGTGHHVGAFNKKGYDAIGIDSSINMVNLASENYPESKFYNSDVMHAYQFEGNTFTHVTMLMMTVYYIQNKEAAFQNIYNWLKPGGYMVIHLVNRDKFDPRIEAADPLYKINAQMFSKERIRKSYVKFNEFQYRGEFIDKGPNSKYIETLKEDDSHKAIRNEHKYYMETKKEIVKKAKNVGFKLKGKIGLDICHWDYEYLYVFVKK